MRMYFTNKVVIICSESIYFKLCSKLHSLKLLSAQMTRVRYLKKKIYFSVTLNILQRQRMFTVYKKHQIYEPSENIQKQLQGSRTCPNIPNNFAVPKRPQTSTNFRFTNNRKHVPTFRTSSHDKCPFLKAILLSERHLNQHQPTTKAHANCGADSLRKIFSVYIVCNTNAKKMSP